MKTPRPRPFPAGSPALILAVLFLARAAWGSGTVTELTQANLQAALDGGGLVSFAVSGTITLSSTITIAQDAVLDASGYAVTLSGGSAVRLFQVNSNVAFSVNGLTLANGRYVGADGASGPPAGPGADGFGAGILNLGGTVTLNGCVLTNHTANGGNAGSSAPGGNAFGAALCNLGGTLNLTNCLLAGNATLGGSSSATLPPTVTPQGGLGLGAAVYSENGQVQIQGAAFTSNSVAGGPNGNAGAYPPVADLAGAGLGGAVYATNSVVLLSGSVLEGNSANGGCTTALGGAVCLDQGSSGVILLCRFVGNAANGAAGEWPTLPAADGYGGAVFSGVELQIGDSSFSSNLCTGGFAYHQPPAGVAHGGAIYSTNALVMNGCTFDSNLAQGGAIGGLLPEPGAAGEGGAVSSSGTLAATNCTWTANQAAGGAAGAGPGSTPPGALGGAGSGGAVCITGGQASLVNVTIAGNRADGGASVVPEGYVFPPSGPAQGGGLYNTNGLVLVLNSIIAGSLNGGDVWGGVTDAGYNICSDGTADFSASTSQNQADPLLAPLANNGGPTETMALLPGSPALDAIPSSFPPVDQCGTPRPQGPKADIGAFEDLVPGAARLSMTFLSSGLAVIQFVAPPGKTYNVESSTDLVHWAQIGEAASTGSTGGFQFIDLDVNLPAARFYRILAP